MKRKLISSGKAAKKAEHEKTLSRILLLPRLDHQSIFHESTNETHKTHAFGLTGQNPNFTLLLILFVVKPIRSAQL